MKKGFFGLERGNPVINAKVHSFGILAEKRCFCPLSVKQVEAKTGIDTKDIRPLAQPWMYLILLGLTIFLLLIDAWTISTAVSL